MKLLRIGDKGFERAAILDKTGNIRDMSRFASDWTGATLSSSVLSRLKNENLESYPIMSDDVRIGPPVGNVGKIIGCALTYGKHAQEAGLKTPKEPMFMLTSRTAINGPYDDVIIPLSLIHISEPTRPERSRMPSSA